MIKIKKHTKVFNNYIKFKNLVITYSTFLRKGKFVISTESKNIIYLLNDPLTKNFVRNVFENRKGNKHYPLSKRIKNHVKNMLFNCLKLKNNNNIQSVSEGSIAMISWDNDYKFFDLINEQVITIFNKEAKLNRFIEDMNYFKMYFNVPFLFKSDNIVYEKLITNNTRLSESEKEKYYIYIVKQYINYTKKLKLEQYEDSCYVMNNVKSNWENFFDDILKSNKQINKIDTAFPLCYMHSDLHFENVLILENEVYFIDWEHSSYKPFFYDVFNVLFIEVMNHNNLYLIKKYFNGKFDELFMDLFKSVDIEFDSKLRESYFLYFIFYRFINFDLTNNKSGGVSKRYKRLMDRLKSLMNNN